MQRHLLQCTPARTVPAPSPGGRGGRGGRTRGAAVGGEAWGGGDWSFCRAFPHPSKLPNMRVGLSSMLNPTQAVHCSASRTSEPSGRRPQSYCTALRERYGLVLRDVSCGDPEVSKHRLDHLHPSPLFRVDEIFEEGRPGLLRLLFDPTIFQRFQARYDCTPVACLGKFWTRFCCSGLKWWRRGGFGTASTGSIGSRSQSMSPVMHRKREESLRFKSSPVAVLSLSW